MPDSQPNYLTIDPAGRIGANFTGHVSAQGIDLPAATGTPPPVVSEVVWKRQSDGSAVAFVYGFESTDDYAVIQSSSPESAGVRQAQLQLIAGRTGVGDRAFVQAYGASVTHPSGHSAIVISDNGDSGFVQQRFADNTFMSWGSINSGGGVVAASADVSSVRNGVGTYGLIFSGGTYTGPYVITATAAAQGCFCDILSFGSGTAQIEVRVSTTGALVDAGFTFTAISRVVA